MTFVPPTASDLKARFPEFAPVSDAMINSILTNEAIPAVGVDWVERDRFPAILYLAAHLLSSEGEPTRSATGTGSSATGPVVRRKVGDVETQYAGVGGGSGGAHASIYDTTVYGRRFLDLLRLNFPAVVTV